MWNGYFENCKMEKACFQKCKTPLPPIAPFYSEPGGGHSHELRVRCHIFKRQLDNLFLPIIIYSCWLNDYSKYTHRPIFATRMITSRWYKQFPWKISTRKICKQSYHRKLILDGWYKASEFQLLHDPSKRENRKKM